MEVADIKWSPEKEKLIISDIFSEKGKMITNFWLIDLQNGMHIKLNDNINNILDCSWKDNDQIMLFVQDEKSKSIGIFDIKNNNFQKLSDFSKSAYDFVFSPDGKKDCINYY